MMEKGKVEVIRRPRDIADKVAEILYKYNIQEISTDALYELLCEEFKLTNEEKNSFFYDKSSGREINSFKAEMYSAVATLRQVRVLHPVDDVNYGVYRLMENSREKQLEDIENYFSRMKKNFKVYHVPLKELKEFILSTLYQSGGTINRDELDRLIKRHFDIDDKIDMRDDYNRALGNLRRINKVKKAKGDRDNVSLLKDYQ